MSGFLHDVGLFMLGWAWGWFCIVSAPAWRKIWLGLRETPKEWKQGRGKSS